MIRKIGFLPVAIFMSLSVASAQIHTDELRTVSMATGQRTGTVRVTEQADAAAIIKSLQASQRPLRSVKGYRVSIFFDNNQYARSQANAAIATFKEIYPDIPTYTSYNTSYKVTVGNCINETEAIILWGRIKNDFPNAVKVSEDIPIDQLLESPKSTTGGSL